MRFNHGITRLDKYEKFASFTLAPLHLYAKAFIVLSIILLLTTIFKSSSEKRVDLWLFND